ncbi:MAG: glycosyltransferase, partial [Candidatus Goldbacteria bacterium]|nr:glycosyltransferase [Candidatus Goldiibacteriota bacterium]
GSTLRAYYLYKYLSKIDKEVDFIMPPFKSMIFMLDFFLSLFYYFFKLLNKQYKIIIIIKPYPNTVLPCLLYKLKGTKIIIDIDDMDWGYRNNFISNIIKFFQNILIKAGDFITSHNTELIKLIKKNNPEFDNKIYYLKQCVDLSIFKRDLKRTVIKEKFKDRKILFYMANMNIASYFEDILIAISGIKEKFILIAIGDGPLLNYYKKVAKRLNLSDKIIFTGACDLKTTAQYLSAADLCLVYYKNVLVNKYRASMKLREYLAMDKPVVANNVGEIKDFKDYIYLSGPSLSSFAKEIKKRIKNLDKRHKKGYKFIYSNYNWEIEAEKFYKFLIETFKNKI